MIDIGKNDASVCNRKLIHKTKGKEWPELLTVVSETTLRIFHAACATWSSATPVLSHELERAASLDGSSEYHQARMGTALLTSPTSTLNPKP